MLHNKESIDWLVPHVCVIVYEYKCLDENKRWGFGLLKETV